MLTVADVEQTIEELDARYPSGEADLRDVAEDFGMSRDAYEDLVVGRMAPILGMELGIGPPPLDPRGGVLVQAIAHAVVMTLALADKEQGRSEIQSALDRADSVLPDPENVSEPERPNGRIIH